MIITIDGPSGSGKSTIAKALAKKLNIMYLDTGAMYRGMGYYAKVNNIDVNTPSQVLEVLNSIDMDIKYINGEQKVFINGEDVTPFIRNNEISMMASTISKIPEVRIKLVELQRQISKLSDCILDGRDIGSYVLPHAEYKFFLTADDTERAKRRHKELLEKGSLVTLEEVLEDMRKRDMQDANRDFAPCVVPEGAEIVDTTRLNIDEVINLFMERVCK